jgi:G3E family GTPase
VKKIPVHIISGFLGSGKTTFLKRIIEKYSDKYKLGIIQNEFAPSNIDGTELKMKNENFHLLEINNGSVFCVCLLGDFVRSLENFVDEYHPDIILIEASGLSDTGSVAEVLSAGSLGEKIFLASNWCIVDVPNFARAGMMKQRVNQQIRMADVVLINKVDLAENQTKQVKDAVKKLNPFAEITETQFCNKAFDVEKKTIPRFYPDEGQPLSRPGIHSMVLKSGRKMSRESLESFLQKWAPKSYRIKGFVNTKDNQTLAVQCTFDTIETNETEKYWGPTELVALSDQFSLREWNHSFRQMT